MNTSSASTTTLLQPSSTTTTTFITTSSSSSSPFSPNFPNSIHDAQLLFPVDAPYLFNYTILGMENNLHFLAETVSQAVATAAAIFVSPTAAFDISRGFALSRILGGSATCSSSSSSSFLLDRDPLANGQRWNQKQLFFPETFLPITNFPFGFGPKENGFYLRVAVLTYLILILVPLITSCLFVKPVAPVGKVVAIFFSIAVALGWGFSSGILVGSVATANSEMRKWKYFYIENDSSSSSSEKDILIVDWVIGIIPICLPLLVMIYFSVQVHSEITLPPELKDFEDDVDENEKEKEKQKKKKLEEEKKKAKKKKQKLNKRKHHRGYEDDEEEEFEEEEGEEEDFDDCFNEDEEEDEENEKLYKRRGNTTTTKNKINIADQKKKNTKKHDDEEEEKDPQTLEDERKRKQKKTNLHVSISKVQFRLAGVGKKSPWKQSLRDWLNSSKIAKFCLLGNYTWKGGELPVLSGLMSFEELKKLRQERIDLKKKQDEEDKKNGKKKKKGFFDQLSSEDEDDDDGRGFKPKNMFTGVRGSYGFSKRSFFDDDEDDGGNGDYFDDDAPVVNEDDMELSEEEQQRLKEEEEEAERKRKEEEEGENEENKPPETEKERKKREKKERQEAKEKEEKERKKKLLEDKNEDFKLPTRPELNSAQLVYNRLGFVLENFYGPPEPLSIEEANRQKIRLPWREKFAVFAPHYFSFNATISTLFSVLCGVMASCPDCFNFDSSCDSPSSSGWILFTLIGLTVLNLVFVSICRPYLVGIQNILVIVSDVLIFVSCILAFLKVPGGDDDPSSTIFLLQILTLFGVAGIGSIRVFLAFLRFCLFYFGDLRVASIYYGKKDKEVKVLQKKIKKKEEKDAEEQRLERERMTSTAVVKKKGGPYLNSSSSGLKDLSQRMMEEDDEELSLLDSLPRARTSSRFKRRAKSIPPSSAPQKQQQEDDYDDNNYANDRSSSPSSSSNFSSSRRNRRNNRNKNNVNNYDDDESSASTLSRSRLRMMQDAEI